MEKEEFENIPEGVIERQEKTKDFTFVILMSLVSIGAISSFVSVIYFGMNHQPWQSITSAILLLICGLIGVLGELVEKSGENHG